jgi:hypothetical protein
MGSLLSPLVSGKWQVAGDQDKTPMVVSYRPASFAEAVEFVEGVRHKCGYPKARITVEKLSRLTRRVGNETDRLPNVKAVHLLHNFPS